jgi:hypothetical protein
MDQGLPWLVLLPSLHTLSNYFQEVLDPGNSQDLCQEQQGQLKTHKIEDFPHL